MPPDDGTSSVNRTEIRIAVPEKVEIVLSRLRGAGYEAYIVGGCVRDALLHRTPGDWDITTSALPGEVKQIFSHTVDTGIRHGTVTVMLGRDGFEVTTYRIDGAYEDGRHPESVTFTRSLLEDLKRRDFTINAMAYSEETGLVDAFDGIGDLDRGLIRCVGDPRERFSEDALRIMRALRFSAQLGYEIEENTLAAARDLAPNLDKVSAERIRVELEKLLVSDHPDRILLCQEIGVLARFLPEFTPCMDLVQHAPHHGDTVAHHTVQALFSAPAEPVLRLAAFLHDIAKPACRVTGADGIDRFPEHAKKGAKMADGILRRLRYDNDTRRQVVALIAHHSDKIDPEPAAVRRAAAGIGPGLFPKLLALQEADAKAQAPAWAKEKTTRVEEVSRCWEEILARGDCLDLGHLAITGTDLMSLGVRPGKEIGALLALCLDAVLEDPAQNEKMTLLARCERAREAAAKP